MLEEINIRGWSLQMSSVPYSLCQGTDSLSLQLTLTQQIFRLQNWLTYICWVPEELLSLEKRGQSNAVPRDLLAVVEKEFNVTVIPRRESLDLLCSPLNADC